VSVGPCHLPYRLPLYSPDSLATDLPASEGRGSACRQSRHPGWERRGGDPGMLSLHDLEPAFQGLPR